MKDFFFQITGNGASHENTDNNFYYYTYNVQNVLVTGRKLIAKFHRKHTFVLAVLNMELGLS